MIEMLAQACPNIDPASVGTSAWRRRSGGMSRHILLEEASPMKEGSSRESQVSLKLT